MSINKKKEQGFIDTPKKKLYERLVSLESYSYTIISFNVYYGVKIAAYLYNLIQGLIPLSSIRFLISVFFGYFVARALMKIAFYIDPKKEWVIEVIACFDFLILGVVLRVHDHIGDWKQVYEDLIFASFITFLSYWLIKNFVRVVRSKTKKASLDHIIATLNQNITARKEKIAELEQETTKVNHLLDTKNKKVAEAKQELAKIYQEIKDITCVHCGLRWKNKKARVAHESKCIKNPNKKITNDGAN